VLDTILLSTILTLSLLYPFNKSVFKEPPNSLTFNIVVFPVSTNVRVTAEPTDIVIGNEVSTHI